MLSTARYKVGVYGEGMSSVRKLLRTGNSFGLPVRNSRSSEKVEV